jgi:ribosome maturation factor RimP
VEVEVREEVRQLAGPLCEEEGFELVDIELAFQGRRMTIRVLLDKPGGITVGDCARMSRRLADCLDMNQTVSASYLLEVSSPGLARPLPTLEAVARFAGHKAGVTLHEARDGRRNFEGTLLEPRDGQAGLRGDDGQETWFEWAAVRSARLIVDPWAGSKRGGDRPERGARWGGSKRTRGEEAHEQ